MNWQRKAAIASAVSKLPSGISYSVYYRLQKRFGGLQTANPLARLQAAADIVRVIRAQGQDVSGKAFCEIGTGRRINIPLGLWLCGASSVITLDLNPYLEPELVMSDVQFIKDHQDEVAAIFSAEPGFAARFDLLTNSVTSFHDLMEATHIRYMAPADATKLNLPDASIDCQISYTVLEHIPSPVILDILQDARRILKPGGLHIHKVDFSDHFSHSDSSISAINFLQFTEKEWSRYAGNRYQYHNRLRLDDYQEIFHQAGLDVLEVVPEVDERSLREIENGFPLDTQFQGRDLNAIAARNALIVGAQHPNQPPTPSTRPPV